MNKQKPTSILLLSLLALSGCAVSAMENSEFSDPRIQAMFLAASPMSGDQLFAVFNNQTWQWETGGGFFAARQRAFIAWSSEGGKPSYGEGRWFTTGAGKFCFRAKWTSLDGAANAVTCFSHRINGNTIFQKREPDGEWYVFKHAKRTKGDEYMKLKKGNYVYHPLKKMKRQMAQANGK